MELYIRDGVISYVGLCCHSCFYYRMCFITLGVITGACLSYLSFSVCHLCHVCHVSDHHHHHHREEGTPGGLSYTLPAYCWGAAGDCWRTAGGLLVNCWWTAYCLSEMHTQILAMTESPQLSIHETMHERPRSSTPEPRQMGVSAQGRLYPMRLAQG